MISGPGRTPWISMAAISTAAGAEPGIASVSTGITAPGTQALSPVSAAMRPSTEPLPKSAFSLLARLAAAYELHAATSSPTPGRMPMKVPMQPERTMVRQYFATSASLGNTESKGLIFTGTGFSRTATRSSANPNAPTSAGTRLKPPARLVLPKENRS